MLLLLTDLRLKYKTCVLKDKTCATVQIKGNRLFFFNICTKTFLPLLPKVKTELNTVWTSLYCSNTYHQ